LRQCFPKEQHCITVFGRNGVTSPFFGGNGVASAFLEETTWRWGTVFGGNGKEQHGMVLHEGVQRELHCLKVYQRNGATWVFTDGTALRELHHVDRLFGRASSSLKVCIFLLYWLTWNRNHTVAPVTWTRCLE
jgi:hypothetical protein